MFDRWLVAAVVLVGLLIAATILTFHHTRQLNDAAKWVAHTREVTGTIEEIIAQLRAAESIQRTYIILGGDDVSPEFATSIAAARSSVDQLETLTADNSDQQTRIPGVRQSIDALEKKWTDTVKARKERGFEAAREIVATGQSRTLTSELQNQLHELDTTERGLLEQRTARSAQIYSTALFSEFIVGMASLIGVMAFTILLRRHLTAQAAVSVTLAEQRERLRTTLASIGDAFISTDVDGLVTNMNTVAEELTGWKNADAIGKPLIDVFLIVNETTRMTVENPAVRAMRDGVIVGLANHTFLIAKDGSERPIDDSAAPIRCKEGEIVGSVLVFRDITERKKAETELRESERRYRAIGEAIDFGVWVCDADGRNTYASESFLRLVGLTQEQCSNAGWTEVLHPDDVAGTLAAWQECAQVGGVWDREHRFKGVDGQWHHVLARGVPLKDDAGQITGWVGINLDIDRLKRAEEELRDADRRKDEFLATLSHELRNPLAPVRNAIQIFHLKSPDIPELQMARDVIDRQMKGMTRLIDDLLDVSRISRNKLELRKERVELAKAIQQAIETSRPSIDEQHHELVVDLPSEAILLDADLTRLSQVFWNLLHNAAKYTEKGGRIELRAVREGSDAVVSIKDNGIGIASDHLPKLFNMFSQAEGALSRAQGGLGIGLSLVKRLLEMHGGTIEAKSDGVGRGSLFVVRLPMIVDHVHAPFTPPNAQGVQAFTSKLRVLVVDDSRDSANSLAMLLRMIGNNVRMAHDGEEAVVAAREFQPDVVLLDIGLPKMNGYEAARAIRQEPWGQQMILIAVTGWGQEEDRRKSDEAGFNRHMVKPVEPTALMKLLDELSFGRTQHSS